MIGTPSTGDPEEDERILRGFMNTDELISKGMCANGCGPLDRMNAWTKRCQHCGFVHQKFTVGAEPG